MIDTQVKKIPSTQFINTNNYKWLEIRELLEQYQSGDFLEWEEGLDWKRQDSHYPALLKDIETYGLRAPVCIEKDIENSLYLANGHHRIAALIDLGYTHVPYCEDFGVSCGGEF